MENYSWQILITQAIVIIILLILIVYLFRQKRIIRLEKRFEDFALISIHDHEKSFFDSVSEILWKWIHNFAKFLNKSTFLKKYSLKYEKHIKYDIFLNGEYYRTIKEKNEELKITLPLNKEENEIKIVSSFANFENSPEKEKIFKIENKNAWLKDQTKKTKKDKWYI